MFQVSGRQGLFPLDLAGISSTVAGEVEGRSDTLPVNNEGYVQISGTREFESVFGNLSTAVQNLVTLLLVAHSSYNFLVNLAFDISI